MWHGDYAEDSLDAQVRCSSQTKRRFLRTTSNSKPLVRCPFPELTPRGDLSHSTPLGAARNDAAVKCVTSGREYGDRLRRRVATTTMPSVRRELQQINGDRNRNYSPHRSSPQHSLRHTTSRDSEVENRWPQQRALRHHSQPRYDKLPDKSDNDFTDPRSESTIPSGERVATLRRNPAHVCTTNVDPHSDHARELPSHAQTSHTDSLPRSQAQDPLHTHAGTGDRTYGNGARERSRSREHLSPTETDMRSLYPRGSSHDQHGSPMRNTPTYGRRSHMHMPNDMPGPPSTHAYSDRAARSDESRDMRARTLSRARDIDNQRHHQSNGQNHGLSTGHRNNGCDPTALSQNPPPRTERLPQPANTGLLQRRRQALALLKKSTRVRPRASSTSTGNTAGTGAYARSHPRAQLPNSNPVTPYNRENAPASDGTTPVEHVSRTRTYNARSRPPMPVRARTHDPQTRDSRVNSSENSEYRAVSHSARSGGHTRAHFQESTHAHASLRREFSANLRSNMRVDRAAAASPQNYHDADRHAGAYESSPPRLAQPYNDHSTGGGLCHPPRPRGASSHVDNQAGDHSYRPVVHSERPNLPTSPAPYKPSANDPPEYADVQEPLFPCPYGCGRKFRAKALKVHERACKKVFQTKRRAFNSADSRGVVKELAKLNIKPPSPDKKKRRHQRAKGHIWRKQSHQLRSAMAACREAPATTAASGGAGASSGMGNGYAAEPEPFDDDLIKCEHCGRKFNETVHERHVKHCRNARSRPNRLVKGSGHAGGVRALAGRSSVTGKYGRSVKPPGIHRMESSDRSGATAMAAGGKRGTRRTRRSLKNVQSKIRNHW